MLSKDENDTLVQTGPGTPMGNLFRRFWLPVALSSELVERDAAPLRLRVLGEDLLAFRDSENRLGLVDAYCAHRRAPLFFGRNEDCGLRCAYHGWKFDVQGQCVDLPNVPVRGDMAAMRQKMAITAYLTHEAGGMVWAYTGPRDKVPEFPAFEWAGLPDTHVHASRWLQRSNYMQGVEGEIDTSHVSFLHREFDIEKSPIRPSGAALTALDGAPEITLRETPYGFNYGARRVLNGRQFWRVTQWMLPMFSQIPRGTVDYDGAGGRAWVPVDDRNVTTFAYNFRSDRPFTQAERDEIDKGQVFPPRSRRGSIQLEEGQVIDTFLPVANKGNDYLIDRSMQRTVNFTGIFGANEQDRCLQESMLPKLGGGAVDRSKEHLVASDLAIVTARRRLLRMARDLQNGIEPSIDAVGAGCGARAISRLCDIADYDGLTAHFAADLRIQAPVAS